MKLLTSSNSHGMQRSFQKPSISAPRSDWLKMGDSYVVTGVDVVCEQCQLTMQKIPDTSYHYSDHEGVEASFTIRRNVTGTPVCYFLILVVFRDAELQNIA